MTAPSPTCSTTLHGEVSDPIGDVRAYPGAPNPPDLVHGTADVCGTNITFTVRLASGPFDATTTLLIIDLEGYLILASISTAVQLSGRSTSKKITNMTLVIRIF